MEVIEGSENIFRDFNDDFPGLRALRADLAALILRTLDDRGLTVRAAEAQTGVPAADFSRIRNVNLGRFTVDRLAKILWKLDVDFDAELQAWPRGAAKPHAAG